jgi:hypothetical protein
MEIAFILIVLGVGALISILRPLGTSTKDRIHFQVKEATLGENDLPMYWIEAQVGTRPVIGCYFYYSVQNNPYFRMGQYIKPHDLSQLSDEFLQTATEFNMLAQVWCIQRGEDPSIFE